MTRFVSIYLSSVVVLALVVILPAVLALRDISMALQAAAVIR